MLAQPFNQAIQLGWSYNTYLYIYIPIFIYIKHGEHAGAHYCGAVFSIQTRFVVSGVNVQVKTGSAGGMTLTSLGIQTRLSCPSVQGHGRSNTTVSNCVYLCELLDSTTTDLRHDFRAMP